MAGINYFGLMRKRYSLAKLAMLTGYSQEDIRHFSTKGELEKKDHKKFKVLWKRSEHNRRILRSWV